MPYCTFWLSPYDPWNTVDEVADRVIIATERLSIIRNTYDPTLEPLQPAVLVKCAEGMWWQGHIKPDSF